MSNTTLGFLAAFDGPWPYKVNDDIFLGTLTTQVGATVCLRGQVNRIIASGASGASCVLPALSNLDEGASLVFVVNDSANSINVYPAPGDTMNGSANAAFAIAAGAVGVFLNRPPTAAINFQSSGAQTTVADWRSAVIT